MAKHDNGRTSSQRGGGKHGTDNGRGGGGRSGDAGAPHEVGGKRANRRAGREQIVRVGLFGGTKVYRSGRVGELRDRFRG